MRGGAVKASKWSEVRTLHQSSACGIVFSWPNGWASVSGKPALVPKDEWAQWAQGLHDKGGSFIMEKLPTVTDSLGEMPKTQPENAKIPQSVHYLFVSVHGNYLFYP